MKWMRWLLVAMVVGCSPALAGGHGYDGYPSDMSPGHSNEPITTEEPQYQHPAIDAEIYGPYYVRIDLAEDHFADVTFQNRLVFGPSTVSDVTFIFEGLTIRTVVESQDGDAPDTLTVYPPPGYYTIPESVTVNENEIGVIEIHQQLMF